MKAIILAAGQGTRLRPVTLTMPKPLVPVANKSLIGYAIDMLRGANVTDIGIIVHDISSPIVSQLGDGAKLGVKLNYIVQAEQKGLAHAASLARDFVGDEPFAMFLGDNIFQDKMTDLISGFASSDAELAIALKGIADPTRFGIAEVKDGRVLRVIEKPKNPPSNLAICGVYLFRKSIWDAIANIKPSARNELEITDAIQWVVSSGAKVTPYVLPGWWIDAGKPDAIINANQLVLGDLPYTPAPDGENVTGRSEVSHRVLLGANSKIIDSVVRGPVIIGDNVTIENSYIGPYTSIGDNVIIRNSEVEASIIMKDCRLLNLPGRIDSSLLADATTVESAVNKVPAVHKFIMAENSYIQL